MVYIHSIIYRYGIAKRERMKNDLEIVTIIGVTASVMYIMTKTVRENVAECMYALVNHYLIEMFQNNISYNHLETKEIANIITVSLENKNYIKLTVFDE